MKKILQPFNLLIFIIAIFPASTFAQEYDFSSITELLEDSSEVFKNRIYVEVFQDNQSIYQYQKGYIQCNNVRLGLASSTKWISAAIFLRLAEQGWLHLDDTIGKYLPVFTAHGKGHFTLRQAYSMSGGLFNPGYSSPYHRDSNLSLSESADSIAKMVDILYEPGSMIGYDGTAMHVWGRAAEVIDSINGNQRDWRTIAKEEFFDLMEMDSTDYSDFYPKNPAVAGGIETTPCDYLRFLNMLANNGFYNHQQILQPSSVLEMFTDQTQSAPIYHTFWPSDHPDFAEGIDTLRYTFGAWFTEKDDFGNIIALTSPGAYGHYPFYDRCRNVYGTFFCFIPVTQGGGKEVENTFIRFLKMLREMMGECNITETNITDEQHPGNVDRNSWINPNPGKDQIRVNIPEYATEKLTLEIISYSGNILLKKDINHGQYIQTNNFLPGLYIAVIRNSNGNVIRKEKLLIL